MLNEKILNKKYFYILAVSGGPDSMFLLNKIHSLGYNFAVAHVNYHQREESDKDEELVQKYCQNWNLPFFVYHVQFKSPKKNFQTEAREIRYNFFQTIAKQWKSRHIITAHHLDDHLETHYLQKKRNSLVEYWGLTPKVYWKDKKIWVLRPLLSINKNQIYRYLTQKNISYAIDKTNYLPFYQRNIARQKINSLTVAEKKILQNEIKQKNRELCQIKKLLKKQIKEVIINSSFNLAIWETNSPELKLRLLYYWINQNTNNAFVNRKKQIFPEVSKQLTSPKKKLTIVLSKNYQIKKTYPWAFLKKIKNKIIYQKFSQSK
jgi:tRNA(Ile)-lysidine synthase